MKVSDILQLKGTALYTITPEDTLDDAADLMAERDVGSLLVVSSSRLVGILTFRELIRALVENRGREHEATVYRAMDPGPLICTPNTELDEVRRMMLARHARYLPVIDNQEIMGVISFYDVAKAVVDKQDFDNELLKAYIRDWPEDDGAEDRQGS